MTRRCARLTISNVHDAVSRIWTDTTTNNPPPSSLLTRTKLHRIMHGGERGPVTFPAFKAGDSVLRGSNGGFDFHTPPPQIVNVYAA
jgi:hypothetical protein